MQHSPWNGSVPTRRASATSTLLLTAALLAPAADATPAPTAPTPASPSLAAPSDGLTSLQTLALPDRLDDELLVDLSLGGEPVAVLLRPHDVRADDFRMFVVGADGAWVPVQPAPPLTVRGEVLGATGSVVSGELRDGRLTALVRLSPGEPVWTVIPAASDATAASGAAPGATIPAAPAGDATGRTHLVQPSLTSALPAQCGTDAAPTPTPDGDGSGPALPLTYVSAYPMLEVDLGVDVDVDAVQRLGSVDDAAAYAESVIHDTSLVFEQQLGLTYLIDTLVVRIDAPGPYATGPYTDVLDTVDDIWSNAPSGVDVDVAQLFTGRKFAAIGGVANLAGTCSAARPGSLVEIFPNVTPELRMRLSAHELGHTMGADHCSQGCGIMSIGYSGPPTFDDASLARMAIHKFGVSCLDFAQPPSAPEVYTTSPHVVHNLLTEWVTVEGRGFTKTEVVEVDGEPIDPFYVNVFGDGQLAFYPPVKDGLGPMEVRIVAPGGPTRPFTVTMVGQDPPVLLTNSVTLPGFPLTYRWAGPLGDLAALLLSTSSDTVQIGAHEQLADVQRWVVAPLDAKGLGTITVPEVPAAAAGLDIHAQVVTSDGTHVTGFSEVATTQVFGLP